MEMFFYENEFKKRIRALKEIRKKAHANERELIDVTITTMLDVIEDYKDTKPSELVTAMESDYRFLKSNSFLWEDVRKFAKMNCIDYYSEFIFENGLELTDDEILALTHDFYKSATDKETFEKFLKVFNKRHKTLGIFEDQYSEFVADSVYLPYYHDVFIQLNRKNTFEDVCSLVHEYGHAIQATTNFHPNIYNSCFAEIISVFYELISFEHYSIVNDLKISAGMAQWDDYNSRILFADDLCDEFDIIKQIKARRKGTTTRVKIARYAKHDAATMQGFIEYDTAENLQYVIAELIGIELYMIYRKDKDKAMYLIHKIMDIDLRLNNEEYYKEIQKLGLNVNRKTSEYQDHLLKRMRTIKKKVETK